MFRRRIVGQSAGAGKASMLPRQTRRRDRTADGRCPVGLLGTKDIEWRTPSRRSRTPEARSISLNGRQQAISKRTAGSLHRTADGSRSHNRRILRITGIENRRDCRALLPSGSTRRNLPLRPIIANLGPWFLQIVLETSQSSQETESRFEKGRRSAAHRPSLWSLSGVPDILTVRIT